MLLQVNALESTQLIVKWADEDITGFRNEQ